MASTTDVTNILRDHKPFDYIVVGGGTSGLVVASRLSEDEDVTVLVVESGKDQRSNPQILTPGMEIGLLDNPEYGWNFASPPQATLNNRTVFQGAGRMLGGSSGLNGLAALYPSRAIIDAWGAMGNKDWSFETLEPYYRRFATTSDPPETLRDMGRTEYYYDASVAKNDDAPIKASYGRGCSEANTAWIDTFDKLGMRMKADLRRGATNGAFQDARTIDPVTGTRSYAALGYLNDAVQKRPNLTVLTESTVSRVILEETSSGRGVAATGVVVRSSNGTETTIRATHEVIIAAGSLHTPQILELSGIGDKTLLEKHGVRVYVDNPNVGENVQDHPMTLLSFEASDKATSLDILRDPAVLQAAVAEIQTTGDGLLARTVPSQAYTPLVDATGIMDSRASEELCEQYLSQPSSSSGSTDKQLLRKILEDPETPVLQFVFGPAQVSMPRRSFAEFYQQSAPENYVSVVVILSHPFSRGGVHIVSGRIEDQPLWDPRYNSEAIDMEIVARAVMFIEKLVGTKPFADMIRDGGKRMPETVADSLEKAREIVRERQIAAMHLSGSCGMRPREQGGVVDERLRVYGVKGLRIVDASVFPLEPLGNIQTTVYAVAERAADMIKEDRRV